MRVMTVCVALALTGAGVVEAKTTPKAGLEIYDCKLNGDNHNYVADHIVFALDTATGAMRVDDGIIEFFAHKPADAVVTGNDASVITFTWGVFMTNSKTQSTKMAYRATYFRSNAILEVTARPAGYRNYFSGRGTCVRQ